MESVAKVRVRYEETDRMGVAYYANYLVWFEVGRTQLFKDLGLTYRRLEDEYECILPIVEAYCKYRKSVGYDDEIKVFTRLGNVSKKGLTFHYRIEGEGCSLVAEGFTRHVVVGRNGKVKSFPNEVYNLLKRIENGGLKARRHL